MRGSRRRRRASSAICRCRRLRAGQRHSRCVVRFRLDACLHVRAAGRSRLAARRPGRSLSRRLGSASRLVPVVAAGELRHARPRAVRGGADARLRARRAGLQDVEVARQHDRAAESSPTRTAPTSCACGRRSSDFTEDLRIGQDIIKANVECLSPPAQHDPLHAGEPRGLRPIRSASAATRCRNSSAICWRRLAELDALVREGYAAFDFNRVFTALFTFCTNDLSAFYFDIRKDALYCDARRQRRAAAPRARCSTTSSAAWSTWLAPILCFTMEEAWLQRFPGDKESVHLHTFPETPRRWQNEALIAEMGAHPRAAPRRHRRAGIEAQGQGDRRQPRGASGPVRLKARTPRCSRVSISARSRSPRMPWCRRMTPPPDAFTLPDVPGAAVVFHHAEGDKCARCWMILPEVGQEPEASRSVQPLRGCRRRLEGAAA